MLQEALQPARRAVIHDNREAFTVPRKILDINRQVVGGDFVSEFFGKTAIAI